MTTSTRKRPTRSARFRPRATAPVPFGRPPDAGPEETVAEIARPLAEALLGRPVPVRLAFFDGSTLGPAGGAGTVCVRTPDALRRLLWAPGELGLSRAFVAGDIEIEGDVFGVLRVLQDAARPDLRFLGMTALSAGARAARRLGALGGPPPRPPEEVLPTGWRHTVRRDASSVSHHYDVGNEFYRLVLGPSLTYSCARFADDDTDLEQAQAAKFELVCRKLGLHERPGMRLLDVGCGWGSMALHAAMGHDARVVGVTVSQEQADLARRRVLEAGAQDRVEIRLQDYRLVRGETFDAISSIGMFEHVGRARQDQYFETLRGLLRPGGRLLNHAISSAGSSRPGRFSFMYRYVFPDAELLDVGEVVLAMERAGFEVRDVESLREHYVKTLHEWVANLEARWDEAVSLAGLGRTRIWRLYMAGCANRFETGAIGVHQVLGVVTDGAGHSSMPPTRSGWEPDRLPPDR